MPKNHPYTVRLSSVVLEKVQEYCAHHGLKQGYFVEKAIVEKLTRELNGEKKAHSEGNLLRILDEFEKSAKRRELTEADVRHEVKTYRRGK